MIGRRSVLLGTLSAVVGTGASAAGPPLSDAAELDALGKFEVVRGRPGTVIGVPHGTADGGTLELGRVLSQRLGAGVVIVTGFWDPKTRQRVNVNRPSEELVGKGSEVLREWQSPRATAANQRYDASVREAAQGRLKAFYEIHSNHKPQLEDSIQVSTLGVSYGDAKALKAAFEKARERLGTDVPRLAIRVSPLDKVPYPNYRHASSISAFSERGCAIEHPGRVIGNREWRLAYAACWAEAIESAPWDTR
jgi:hypothetical protein